MDTLCEGFTCLVKQLVVAVLLLAALVVLSTQAVGAAPLAQAIVVNTTADELTDNGNCSLREAIQAANTHVAVDACGAGAAATTIQLGNGVYQLSLPGADEDANASGDLDVGANITLVSIAAGPVAPTIDGGQIDRVVHVLPSGSLTISGVTIRNGRAPDGADLQFYGMDGSDGGGIYNAGSLVLLDSLVENNRTGDGGSASDAWSPFDEGDGGHGGRGGGVYNVGTLVLSGVIISGNITGNGGRSGGASAFAPDGGAGGGIYNAGALAVTDSTIRVNRTGVGGYRVAPPSVYGGAGGRGGGIANVGSLTLENSTLSSNRTGDGASPGGSHAEGGDGGPGGGIYSTGIAHFTNSTLSDNQTGAGGAAMASAGDGGDGGGIYMADGTLTGDNVTVAGNNTGSGGEIAGWVSTGHAGAGGGISARGGLEPQLRNTLLAGNASAYFGPDCRGPLYSLGHNLLQSVAGCTVSGDATGNVTGRDARLLPLADNGGRTWTQALSPGSPAIDAATCYHSPPLDQRGVARPQGPACDIGAYEAPVFPKIYLPLLAR